MEMVEKALKEIFSLPKRRLKLFMNPGGAIFWSHEGTIPVPLSEMPERIQVHFLMKCIHDHDLAERTKNIQNSIAWIDMYIKAKFICNKPLEV